MITRHESPRSTDDAGRAVTTPPAGLAHDSTARHRQATARRRCRRRVVECEFEDTCAGTDRGRVPAREIGGGMRIRGAQGSRPGDWRDRAMVGFPRTYAFGRQTLQRDRDAGAGPRWTAVGDREPARSSVSIWSSGWTGGSANRTTYTGAAPRHGTSAPSRPLAGFATRSRMSGYATPREPSGERTRPGPAEARTDRRARRTSAGHARAGPALRGATRGTSGGHARPGLWDELAWSLRPGPCDELAWSLLHTDASARHKVFVVRRMP